jgi:hypothetical protein
MPPIYEFYIEDARYTVPTLSFLAAASDDDARDQARRLLQASPHYGRVDVGVAGATLFTVDRERPHAVQDPELKRASA